MPYRIAITTFHTFSNSQMTCTTYLYIVHCQWYPLRKRVTWTNADNDDSNICVYVRFESAKFYPLTIMKRWRPHPPSSPLTPSQYNSNISMFRAGMSHPPPTFMDIHQSLMNCEVKLMSCNEEMDTKKTEQNVYICLLLIVPFERD